MILGPKTVLLADDEPAVLALYRRGLPPHLPGFEVVTVAGGDEAIAYLTEHPVTVLVTDIIMPPRDGFEVLAFVRHHHPNLPVVVLSAMAATDVLAGLPRLGALQVLQKPVPPAQLGGRILAAYEETTRGRLAGVPLPTLLQLIQAERKSCALHLRYGDERGRLHFLAGELVNAYAFELDTEGEAAARHLLAWESATVEFERSLHNHVRTIRTPLTTLLLDVVRTSDEARRDALAQAPEATASPPAAAPPPPAKAPDPVDAVVDRTAEPPSEARTLVAAAADLQLAIAGLRSAAVGTADRLAQAAPDLRAATAALDAERSENARAAMDVARVARLRREVANLAARLAHAAEAMGAPPAPETST